MTTVDDFGEYTGAHGVVTVDGVPFADVEYDIKWSRTTVTHSRASKFSDIQIPGKLTVKTTIKKALVHSEAAMVLGYSLTDTSVTGTAGARLAATTIVAGTAVAITTDPATPSMLDITITVGSTTAEGQIIVGGTDANDDPIAESFVIPNGTALGTVFHGAKVFKTCDFALPLDITSGTGAKFQVDSVAGVAYAVHNPKIFDLVGGVTKAGKSITITQPDCWFSEGGLSFVDAGSILEVNSAVEMHDPDLLEVVVVG